MSIFTHIFSWVKNLFNAIPKEIREYASQSLEVTVNIRNFLNSPVADIITAIIPGTWDDSLKVMAVKYLSEAIPYLTIVDECKDATDEESMIKCWVDKLAEYQPEVRDALLFKLATLLTAKFDNNEALKQSFYALAVQAKYTHTKIEE